MWSKNKTRIILATSYGHRANETLIVNVKKTGVYCLLNALMNIHGVSMCCSPQDAFFTFKNSSLERLILEDYILLRKS